MLRRSSTCEKESDDYEDSAMVDALRRRGVAGTVMLVMGGAPTGFFGVVKQKITTAIGVTVDSGPAKPLINEVTWHFRTLSTPVATKIGMIDRSWEEETHRGRQQAAIGHIAQARLIAGGSAHPVNEWLISVAQRVADPVRQGR